MKSLKNSFIFLETIVSLVVISIIISAFFTINSSHKQELEFKDIFKFSNEFKTNNYENSKIYTKNLSINKNNVIENLSIKVIEKNSKNIKLVKYELK